MHTNCVEWLNNANFVYSALCYGGDLGNKIKKTLVDSLKIHHKYCKQLSPNSKAYGTGYKNLPIQKHN